MSSLYKQFATSPDSEKKGIELQYNLSDTVSVVLLVARAGGGNQRFQRLLEQKTKPYRRQIQTETIEPATLERLMREVYSESVVIGWWTVIKDKDGKETRLLTVEDGDGIPMDFTAANVVKLFTDLPELFADVQSQAQKVALFRQLVLDDSAKN